MEPTNDSQAAPPKEESAPESALEDQQYTFTKTATFSYYQIYELFHASLPNIQQSFGVISAELSFPIYPSLGALFLLSHEGSVGAIAP